jgi:manganese/iron transport system substrate-binding protein
MGIALTLMLGMNSCGAPSGNQATNPSPLADSTPNSAAPVAVERPLVVATSSVVCDLTRQIAADTVDLKCLIAPGMDPHEYSPKPEDSKALEQAKLILYSGFDFEHQLIKLVQGAANNAPKIAVAEQAVPNPQQFEEDGKTEIDPHVFHNAAHGIAMAEVINQKLSQLEPNNAQIYTANTKKVTDELTQINAWIKSQIATIPATQRQLVTTHDAFGYYSQAYDIPVVGALQGISTEEKATPARVTSLVKDIKKTGVPTIFAEATINPKLLESVAKEANIKVAKQELFADGIGEQGSAGDTYQKMLEANTRTIVEGLGGNFTPFSPQTSMIPNPIYLPAFIGR